MASMSAQAPFGEQTVADVMLAEPKTLPADATVADARRVLHDHHVQLLLLAEGRRFHGAITEIPVDADDDAPAARWAQAAPATIGPDEPAALGFERAKENPQRRIVVVDEDENLLGLLCLKASLAGFCGRPSAG